MNLRNVYYNTERVFYALLSYGLWGSSSGPYYQNEFDYPFDWNVVFQLAKEQCVWGVTLMGVECLSYEKRPPSDLLLKWIAAVQVLEKRNQLMNVYIEELFQRFETQGIFAFLIKGQGVAHCYEKPLWRVSGDIDLFLNDDNYETAKKFLVPLSKSLAEEAQSIKHYGLFIDGWEVELHGSLRTTLMKRIDQGIDAIQERSFRERRIRYWHNNSTDIPLPHYDDDIVYVFTHIVKHFFHGGVGLRQICDWCRLLWTYRLLVDVELLTNRICGMGLLSEWKTFAAFAVKYLAMPEEAMPMYSRSVKWERKARRVNSYILRVGNFGHNRDSSYRNKAFVERKLFAFCRHTADGINHFFIFPVDSFCIWLRMLISGIVSVLHNK